MFDQLKKINEAKTQAEQKGKVMIHNLRPSIERICRKVFPERPIYVLFAREIPEQFRPRGVFGATGRGLDLPLKDYIGPRWRGRGACIILDDSQCRLYALEAHPFLPEKLTAYRELIKAAVHELAHVASRTVLPNEIAEDDPNFCEAVRFSLTNFCKNLPPASNEQSIPWDGHDGQFIRLLLHGAYRVRQHVATWLPFDDWFRPRMYGLAKREDQYRLAIGDEPERLATVPLMEISKIQPPAAFKKLWTSDILAWWQAIRNPTDEQTAALMHGLKIFS